MTDKEQIIIDGVNIIGTIDEWARLVAHEWGTDEYSDAEIVKNYILDINKQLARKTQEYNELTLQIRETQEYSDTCAECKDDIFTNVKTSYSQIEVESRALAKIISSLKSKTQECEELEKQLSETKTFDLFSEKIIEKLNTSQIMASIFQDYSRYRKALEEIEKLAIKTNRDLCNNCGWVNTISCIPSEYICGDIKQILDIINKAKEENNGINDNSK